MLGLVVANGRGQVGEHRGHALRLEEVDHPQQGRMNLGGRAAKGGDRVHHDNGRPERFHKAVHQREMHLEPVEARARCLDA